MATLSELLLEDIASENYGEGSLQDEIKLLEIAGAPASFVSAYKRRGPLSRMCVRAQFVLLLNRDRKLLTQLTNADNMADLFYSAAQNPSKSSSCNVAWFNGKFPGGQTVSPVPEKSYAAYMRTIHNALNTNNMRQQQEEKEASEENAKTDERSKAVSPTPKKLEQEKQKQLRSKEYLEKLRQQEAAIKAKKKAESEALKKKEAEEHKAELEQRKREEEERRLKEEELRKERAEETECQAIMRREHAKILQRMRGAPEKYGDYVYAGGTHYLRNVLGGGNLDKADCARLFVVKRLIALRAITKKGTRADVMLKDSDIEVIRGVYKSSKNNAEDKNCDRRFYCSKPEGYDETYQQIYMKMRENMNNIIRAKKAGAWQNQRTERGKILERDKRRFKDLDYKGNETKIPKFLRILNSEEKKHMGPKPQLHQEKKSIETARRAAQQSNIRPTNTKPMNVRPSDEEEDEF